MHEYRGSRKHVLEWVISSQFRDELNLMLSPTGALVTQEDHWQPNTDTPDEAELSSFGPRYLPTVSWSTLSSWWLPHPKRAKTPTWDLVSTCEAEGVPGLVLVEAKANRPELSSSGKLLRPWKDRSTGELVPPSSKSLENHEHIGRAIEEAGRALSRIIPGVSISRDRSYQVSNRIAFAWRLTQLGVPTVLVFLGFTGDKGIDYVGPHFEDGAVWQSHFTKHISHLFPVDHLEERIDCGLAPMWVLSRSRPVKNMTVRPTRRSSVINS